MTHVNILGIIKTEQRHDAQKSFTSARNRLFTSPESALLLVMAALRQLGRGAGVDVGEEVGAIVDQGAEIELESLDEPLSQLPLGLQDLVGGNEIHVVPEVLGGEQCGIDREQAGEDGAAVPVSQVHLTGRSDGAVEGGEQKVLATG